MVHKAGKLNEKYELDKKAQHYAAVGAAKAYELNQKHQITGKVSSGLMSGMGAMKRALEKTNVKREDNDEEK